MQSQTNDQEKILRRNLFYLELNFSAVDPETRRTYRSFSPPTFVEAKKYQQSNNETHPLVIEMLAGDAAQKLYAAILLSEIDRLKSESLLTELAQSSEIIKVQNKVGHGLIEIPVKYAAQSFQKTGDIRTGFIETAEHLSKWKIAIAHEARRNNKPFAPEILPTAEEVFEASADRKSELHRKMIELSDDEIISKRFFAASVLQEIDEPAARRILEDLQTNDTSVAVLFGDIMHEIPAREVASAILEKRQIMFANQNSEPPELTGKILNSIKDLLFGNNKQD